MSTIGRVIDDLEERPDLGLPLYIRHDATIRTRCRTAGLQPLTHVGRPSCSGRSRGSVAMTEERVARRFTEQPSLRVTGVGRDAGVVGSDLIDTADLLQHLFARQRRLRGQHRRVLPRPGRRRGRRHRRAVGCVQAPGGRPLMGTLRAPAHSKVFDPESCRCRTRIGLRPRPRAHAWQARSSSCGQRRWEARSPRCGASLGVSSR